MDAPVLSHLRLTAFKSYLDQALQLRPLTLLVGPNASGKSNVIDALSLLALLADERSLADLERGDDTVAGLRGGISGAAPFGDPTIKIGCTVRVGEEEYDLDLTLDAGPTPEVVDERLVRRDGRGRQRELLYGRRQGDRSGRIEVDVYSGGAPRRYTMPSARPATVQAASRIPMDSAARRSVVQACGYVTSALQGVFVHDPVPGRMREYSQIGSAPDRWGTTMSAVVYGLMKDPDTRDRLLALVRGLVDANVADLKFAEAKVDGLPIDVMVAVQERAAAGNFLAQARVMSDGTLRYLAIVSTLLYLSRAPAELPATVTGGRTLVVEEIENGLFPTQASRILDLLRDEATRREMTLLTTTHSPALLDALRPDDHDGVIVCGRDDSGRTTLRRLVDHDRYVEIAGGGTIGSAVARGELSPPPATGSRSFTSLFAWRPDSTSSTSSASPTDMPADSAHSSRRRHTRVRSGQQGGSR